jgi:hypothetical protein
MALAQDVRGGQVVGSGTRFKRKIGSGTGGQEEGYGT